jgi:Domain of unknown function (DUF397)
VAVARRPGGAVDDAAAPDSLAEAAEAPRWRKASASASGGCVEVAGSEASVLVRDSKDPAGGPVIAMTREDFAALLAGIRGHAG